MRCQITGDILRPAYGLSGPYSHQTTNIKWIATLISDAIATVIGTSPTIVCDGLGFSFETAWQQIGLEPSQENWAHIYEGGPDNEAAVDILSSTIKAELVIAFEPSPALEQAVARSGSRLIAISIHPYRFAHDLFLGLRVNDPALHKSFLSLAAAGSHLRADATVIRARCIRESGTGNHRRSLVLFLQDTFDATLIHGGLFQTIDDLVDHSSRYIHDFEDVLVRPRPHTPFVPAEILQRIANRLGRDVRVTTAHAYRLISDLEIGAFAAISSGALDEAEFFGRTTFRTVPRRQHLAPLKALSDAPVNSILPIDSRILQPDFWQVALKNAGIQKSMQNAELATAHRAILRDCLGEDWGLAMLSSDSGVGIQWYRPVSIPAISANVTHRFCAGSPILSWLRGLWQEAEVNHIWTMTPNAYLIIPISINDSQKRTLMLTLRGFSLDIPNVKAWIKVKCNNVHSKVECEQGSWKAELQVYFSESDYKTEIRVDIETERAIPPMWINPALDDRRLGIALSSITLEDFSK